MGLLGKERTRTDERANEGKGGGSRGTGEKVRARDTKRGVKPEVGRSPDRTAGQEKDRHGGCRSGPEVR